MTVELCTNVDPATFAINGRSITVTHEESTTRIWYDGLASEFDISDFTNDDKGYCFYKVTNNDNGDVYYSDLMCIYEIIYPPLRIGVKVICNITLTESGTTYTYPVDSVVVNIDSTPAATDEFGEAYFVVDEGTYDVVAASGSQAYDTGTSTGTATWIETTESVEATVENSTPGTGSVKYVVEKTIILDEIVL